MTNALTTIASGMGLVPAAVERALIGGDLSRLSETERLSYYNSLCTSLGLNPLTKPFQYITLNGKLTLYAAKDCTDQLRSLRGVSITELTGQMVDDLYVVSAKGSDKSGRSDAATGAVVIGGLRGEAKANAIMKAETKAKRRLTLSLCGLGMLDESEVDSIEGARTHAPAVVAKPLNLAPVAPAPVVEALAREVLSTGSKEVIKAFKALKDPDSVFDATRVVSGPVVEAEPVAEAPASAPADLEAATDSLEQYAAHIKAAKTLDELVEVWGAMPKAMRSGLVKVKDERKKELTEPPKKGEEPASTPLTATYDLARKIALAQTKMELDGYALEGSKLEGENARIIADVVKERRVALDKKLSEIANYRGNK